jgi:hypothetical protein
MSAVMRQLELATPPFLLHRRIVMWREGRDAVHVAGIEHDGTPYSLVRRVTLRRGPASEEGCLSVTGPALPLILRSPELASTSATTVECEFFGHYHEPTVCLTLAANVHCASWDLHYNPISDTAWEVRDASYAIPDLTTPKRNVKKQPGWAEAPHRPQLQDFTGYHAVTPLDDCPHTSCVHFAPDQVFDLNAPCTTCGNTGENMICLQCGVVACGRHVASHMVSHHDATQHPMVCGMIDLSFWCYECDAYISPSNPRLRQFYAAMHLAKFGSIPWA